MAKRTYPSAKQIEDERYPSYGDVFLEWHGKRLPFTTKSRGQISGEQATDVAKRILKQTA